MNALLLGLLLQLFCKVRRCEIVDFSSGLSMATHPTVTLAYPNELY